MQSQLVGGEDHQQAFARTLEVPDETLANLPLDDPLNNLVHRFILLVATNDFDFAFALVGGERSEILSDVEHNRWLKHGCDSTIEFLKTS